ncbi:DSD1 family PLP-dependent enzyme [bacterium]|nr:DSD1 family PLP-dependent enzyme [bacterium]
MPQALIGASKADLDTPVLCLDVEQFARNAQHMAEVVTSSKKLWRPHSKGHKSPAIAWHEQRLGAKGVTCAKLGEAEVMAAAGITNILVANVIAGERKAERLAALCRWSDPTICCDHFTQAEQISQACQRVGTRCQILVDVNIGMNRTGIRPGKDAVELGQAIDQLPGLTLLGIMGYEGHLLKIADTAEKTRQIREAISILENVQGMYQRSGLRCDVVSAGGTGSVHITSQCPAVTELQAGGGIFGDPFYTGNCGLTGCEPALTVLATVVSRPHLQRAILDAGRKTVNPDLQMPVLRGYPDAEIKSLSAEHCTIELGPESQNLRIGDQVELVVGYGDLTTVLHDDFYVFRGERLEAIWPISGRGRLQ